MFVRLGAAFCLLAVGCATARSSADVRAAERAIDQARRLGAEKDFGAALHLEIAGDQLRRARAAAAVDDADETRRWALRSQSDAALAALLAQQVRVREATRKTLEQAEGVAHELDRQPDPARTLRHDAEEER
jgi:hypothetical protein